MIIKHNTLASINTSNAKSRKTNDFILIKDKTFYKFSVANINTKLIVDGVLNLKLLNKRADDLKELLLQIVNIMIR